MNPTSDAPLRIALVVGTRPEAIKMAPLHRALSAHGRFTPVLISAGQHAELLQTALAAFDLQPDHELAVMTPGQSLTAIAARILDDLPELIARVQPAALLVQGDTTTALAAGLAGYYARIPIGHVEAGLRTYDHENPFPEEANRQLIDRLSTWCFSPTNAGRENLLAERIPPDRIHVTGNTGIDALLWALDRVGPPPVRSPYVLLTLHRRESFGPPLREILSGVGDFLEAHTDARVIWPVHPNPQVSGMASEVFGQNPRVELVPPQDYMSFAQLMSGSRFILTDSGGIQEEAPSLGKRVLVARDTTERPEAVQTGQNRLVGRQRRQVAAELSRAWTEPASSAETNAMNPYGDGQASERIVAVLLRDLALATDRPSQRDLRVPDTT